MVVEIKGRTLFIIGLLMVVLAGAAWFGMTLLAERQAEAAALELTKKKVIEATAAAEGLISLDSEKSEQSYKEYFDQSASFLSKQAERLVDIEAAGTEDKVRSSAIAYVKALSDIVRLSEQRYRKGLAASSAADSFKDAQSDYISSPYNEYTYQWESRQLSSARDDAREALDELEKANKDYVDGISTLRKRIDPVRQNLDGFKLLSDEFLKNLQVKTNAKAGQ